MYPPDLQEESLKQRVANDFFSAFIYEPLDRIDFAITLKEANANPLFPNIYALWAEAKRGDNADIYESLVQLILTIGTNNLHRIHPIPEFIGAFDSSKIAFLPYKYIKDFVMRNDFDWTTITPSEHSSEAFLRMQNLTDSILREKSVIFHYAKDTQELHDFIKNSVAKGKNNPIEIDLENFDLVYLQWYRIVLPTINLKQNAWKYARDNLIALESDFFLADLLSCDNTTINHNLRILLNKRIENEKEKLHYNIKIDKGLFSWNTENIIFLNDDDSIHAQFWNRYKRPPKEEFWEKIYQRRDKLSPDDIRERKGAFFTPKMWVKKAQEYLAESLGEDWQENYYIWDCAAGTGNLLVGLKNARNIYASTIDLSDVLIIKELNKNDSRESSESDWSGNSADSSDFSTKDSQNLGESRLNLLDSHIFQFDFLNDSFFDKVDKKSGKILMKSKLPESLQNIIKNEPQRLVIFMNPPYKEASSTRTTTQSGENASGVSNTTQIHEQYRATYKKAVRELFAQFFVRIYNEIPNSILASFSTLKYVNATNFADFRKNFKAKFLKGFAVPSYSFDNVRGKFPIGFLVWNLGDKRNIKKCKLNIFNEHDKMICKKNFYANKRNINQWIKKFLSNNRDNELCAICTKGTDFQNSNFCNIDSWDNIKGIGNAKGITKFSVNKYNLFPVCVYFAVRHAIKPKWTNDRDQFLYPNKKWHDDKEFHYDCLAFALFHNQNRISAKIATNHLIPFSESEVGASGAFKSDFMTRFINGKVVNGTLVDCFIPTQKIAFSNEAEAVFSAGRELWRYYHKCAKNSDSYLNDANLYDIREFFQKRDKLNKLNAKSDDSHYNDLIAELRITLQNLADKITPKIYEYEFLQE